MTGTAAEMGSGHRRAVLALCLVAGFMTLLDVSIVNVALPSMQQGLHASPAALAWVVSGYALTFGLVLIPAGRLGDQRGRGRAFVLAMALFTLASALAGFAQNAVWLVLARLLQGAAGGMLNPQVLGLMQQMFQGRERAKAFGLFGAVVGISTAIGPLLGGLIIELAGGAHGWRWVFFVNLPIGVIASMLAIKLIPREAPKRALTDLDTVGVALLGGGVLCLLLPLVERGAGGVSWFLFPCAPVLLALFVYWEHRYEALGHAPLVNLALLRISSYAFGSTIGLLYFAGFTSIFFVLALYYQHGLGYSALQAGLAMTPFAVGSALSSALSGRIVPTMGRKLVVLGMCTALLGLLATDIALRTRPGSAAGLITAVPLLVAGLGSGMVIAPNQTVTLSEVDIAQGGIAAGVQQTAQRVGSALGIATASGVFFASLSRAGYDGAISAGLLVAVSFVGAGLLVGVLELLQSARHRRQASRS